MQFFDPEGDIGRSALPEEIPGFLPPAPMPERPLFLLHYWSVLPSGINGLHCISFFLVRGTGIENLRMLHHQCVLFAHNPSAQSDHAAPPQCVAKKRHPKPDHFQSAGHVFQIECGDLHFFILTDLDPPEDRADDSDCLSLLDLSNGNRIFIDIIGPR